jgi:hypothetical protein
LGPQDDEYAEHPEHRQNNEPFQQLEVMHVEGKRVLVREMEPMRVNHLYQQSSCGSDRDGGKLHPFMSWFVVDLADRNVPISLVIPWDKQSYLKPSSKIEVVQS